jgi:hypothetical protein
MARLTDIDEWLEGHLQFLKEDYFETDPDRGEESEIAKHEFAQMAVEKLWYLQGKLLSWAQAHLTGHSILSENPELVSFLEEKLGYEIHEDCHVLEQLGLVYNFNPPNPDDPALERMKALLEEFNALHPGDGEIILPASAMRRTIRELLMSRCADNSYWRFDLQHSLAALNEGEVDTLATPSPGKRQGLPYSLNRWKLEALRQVRFRVGKGYKKYRALDEVSQAIGQSPETLRSWEKDLEKSHDRAIDLYCSELAGFFDRYFSGDNTAIAPEAEEFETWRGLNHVEHAKYLHKVIAETTIEDVRDAIRRFRQKENGA